MITQKDVFNVAVEHGFHTNDTNPLYVPTALALIMAECAEAIEWHRQGKSEELPHELADIVIRTMDLAASLRIDLNRAIKAKHEFNKSREFKHGGKLY